MTDRTRTPAPPSAATRARIAGALYLAIIALGLFGELGVRSAVLAPGDAAQTAANVAAAELRLRLGFLADTAMLCADVALAVLLYLLLRPAGHTLALLAAAFRLTMDAVLAANLLLQHAVLLLHAEPFRSGLPAEQLTLFALEAQSFGYDFGLVFFGVACLLLGRLIACSDFILRLLGHGLVAAGLVYLTGSVTRILAPDLAPALMPLYVVPLAAELSLALWLALRGVRASTAPRGPADGGRRRTS
ncbi:DUF4386 domain-containing protein [Roseitranquillus sediminis]|uniref:DUF4386 domain-containing protein n=1 Tax=Roseitranquillus sediminis TaxID=2809051 RepID=UPI001D0CB626|nr:DUF4386 domain-containing protein [Roseitranquillus sediminis]MBM9595249.1 DUF4386 domain-containing protein [Roseitranquillus sediminis]